MKRSRLYLIAVFLPLLVWSCGGKDPLPDLIPPPPGTGNEQGGQGGSGGSGGSGGGEGGGTETHPWDANRDKVVRPAAGNGWTVTPVREGITYYAFSGTDVVSGVKQEACAIDLDLSNTKYVVQLTYSTPALVTSDVFKNHNAIVAMNAGYEAGSIYIRIPDGQPADKPRANKSDLPNFEISSTGVPNWKSEAAFFCNGVRNVRIAGAGAYIRPYKAPDEYRSLVTSQRTFYQQQQDDYIISSAPMLLDDYNPVGETFIDTSISSWSSLNSEHPQRHQRQRHPRTAVALTHDNHLILFVVDGRTTISNGMSAKELTQFLVKYFNPKYALNMDGGGSTAMCVEGLGDAETHLVNKPCDTGGRADKQRARDTHFVILEAQ